MTKESIERGCPDPEILRMIAERQEDRERLLITVDGPCASGKTTFALRLADRLEAPVIHTDDFVVPHAQKTPERLAVPGGNCDAERLVHEVIVPWKRGEAVKYRKYDCGKDRLMPEETLPDGRMLILEGSYCNLPAIREYADLRLFADAPWETRKKRLYRRETAQSLQMFFHRWIPLEDQYFSFYALPDEDCVIISTGGSGSGR